MFNNLNIKIMDESLLDQLSEEQLEALLEKKRAGKAQENEKKRLAYETLKDESLNKLGYGALHLFDLIMEFKKLSFDELDAVYDVLQDHSQRHRDGKGNFTIQNDNFKIIYRHQINMDFDERAEQAKLHILDFVNTQWDGDANTRELILNLMNTTNGSMDVRDIQKLYKMEDRFDNENWRIGLKLLKESYTERDTKDYIRYEKKEKDGSFSGINLNFSKIDINEMI